MRDPKRDGGDLFGRHRAGSDLRSRIDNFDLELRAEPFGEDLASARRHRSKLLLRSAKYPERGNCLRDVVRSQVDSQRRFQSRQRELVASECALQRVGLEFLYQVALANNDS